ncbi:hypothetical protein ACFUYE_15020 [Micromonospora humida]|uniref:hypothetical protein n=1 Tax=Micromonospora humida TaxID=2809018 RepID=UPI00366C0973
MVNWVRRGDIPAAVKYSSNWFAVVTFTLAFLMFGSWWWLVGAPVVGAPSRGWRRVGVVAVRAVVFAAAWWVASQEGGVRWVGTVGMLVVTGCGWVAFLRRQVVSAST